MLSRLSFRTTGSSIITRFASNSNANKDSHVQDAEIKPPERALPFEAMPEPKSLPIIGTALDYTPFRGFHITKVHEHWARRHQQYGDIFKEKLPGSNYIVFCRTKEDTEKLFRMEGRMPSRMYYDTVTKVKTIMGYPESLINAEGEMWWRLRQPLNNLILKKPEVWKHAEKQRQVCKEAVQYILKHRDQNMEVPNFEDFMKAWAFEIAAVHVFGCTLGLLRDNPPAEFTELFEANKKELEYIGSATARGIWTYIANIGLKRKLLRKKEIMVSIIERQKRAENFDGSLLRDILNVKSLSDTEKESLIQDLISGAVGTASNAMVLCLYGLTISSRVQDRLREEVKSLSPEQRSSGRVIDGMSYMNAFFKEVHRLLPIIHSMARTLHHDVVLSGYKIPAGTGIINTINSTLNTNPEYFENPTQCIPERWMDKSVPRFQTTGPFGVGARACPGRFAAKQEMFLFLTEILSEFEVQYHHGPATSIPKATGVLSKEPRFSFVSLK